jgi:putative transposase
LRDAESIIETCGPVLELPKSAADLAKLRKGDERKALLAAILRARTSVGFDWIAKRLAMGHPGSVSRLVSKVKQDPKLQKRTHELEKMLQ